VNLELRNAGKDTGTKERPILFKGEMVRALLEGRKTQTRRVVKVDVANCCTHQCGGKSEAALSHCPYGQPGDRLWVRETFHPMKSSKGPASYRATWPKDDETPDEGWKPSIHMPRWASRITLEIVAVRVERLQQISNEDCFAEGLPADTTKGNRTWYADLWESINGKGSWNVNPWVWVVEFKRVESVGVES